MHAASQPENRELKTCFLLLFLNELEHDVLDAHQLARLQVVLVHRDLER